MNVYPHRSLLRQALIIFVSGFVTTMAGWIGDRSRSRSSHDHRAWEDRPFSEWLPQRHHHHQSDHQMMQKLVLDIGTIKATMKFLVVELRDLSVMVHQLRYPEPPDTPAPLSPATPKSSTVSGSSHQSDAKPCDHGACNVNSEISKKSRT